jgi:hypothetical protein
MFSTTSTSIDADLTRARAASAESSRRWTISAAGIAERFSDGDGSRDVTTARRTDWAAPLPRAPRKTHPPSASSNRRRRVVRPAEATSSATIRAVRWCRRSLTSIDATTEDSGPAREQLGQQRCKGAS